MLRINKLKRNQAKQKMAQILQEIAQSPQPLPSPPSPWKWLYKGFDDLSHSPFSLIYSLGIFAFILFVIRLAYMEQHTGMLFPLGLTVPTLLPLISLFYIRFSQARMFKQDPRKYERVKTSWRSILNIFFFIVISLPFSFATLRTGTHLLHELFPGPCPNWIELISGFFCASSIPVITKNMLAYLAILIVTHITSLMSLPIIIFEKQDVIFAINKSVEQFRKYPVLYLKWIFIISLLQLVSLFLGVIGSIIVLPIIGHGYYHLYEELKDA